MEMGEWLERRFPVDGQGADAWTVAESQIPTGILMTLGGAPFPYADDEYFQKSHAEYLRSIKSSDLPKQDGGDLGAQWDCCPYAEAWLTVVDKSVQGTLPSGETSPLAITLAWHGFGTMRGSLIFQSLATRERYRKERPYTQGSLRKAVEVAKHPDLYPSLKGPRPRYNSSSPVVVYDFNKHDYPRSIADAAGANCSDLKRRINDLKERDNWAIMSRTGVDAMFEYIREQRIVKVEYARSR
jgi:hypothetical protein